MVHVRDEYTQRFCVFLAHQAAVIGARGATNDDVADRVAEKRNTCLFQHALRDGDRVLFAKRGGGLGQELSQKFVMARVHGARL
jgi:hypothetical protein